MSKQRSLKELFTVKPVNARESEESSESGEDEGDTDSHDCDSDSEHRALECFSVKSSASSQSHTGIISEPNQPRLQKFPPKKFGKQNRSFNSKWFANEKWSPWLHWDNHVQKAFCYICRNVFLLGQLTMSKNMEDTFICLGFDNWKRGTSAFEQHRLSKCHQESVLKWNHHLKGTGIDVQLDCQLSLEQKKNLHCLEIIFSSIEYLARQCLPLRGHEEQRGNLYQLIKLRANDCNDLHVWMQRKRSFLSHEIQNEMLKILSHQILRSIIKDISSSLWYSIMEDETVDACLIEQVSSY